MTVKEISEKHYFTRVAWLRAGVLGANDGIVSTASLLVGVAAAGASRSEILTAGVAGLVAGAMSMAAGEYVSVSSQADTEKADLERERSELETDWEFECRELSKIYEDRGLEPKLATEVATQLMEHDALAAHARDELGIVDANRARPLQAAFASAVSFFLGGALPMSFVFFGSTKRISIGVSFISLVSLILLGGVAARVGGSSIVIGAGRVFFWGVAAMAMTAFVGKMFGAVL